MNWRSGKIGRLPAAVRDRLNERLRDGATGIDAAEWLNSMPEVQQALAAEFDGRPISAQNVRDWGRSGYQEWFERGQALDATNLLLKENGKSNCGEAGTPLSEPLSQWLAARYAVAAHQSLRPDGAVELKTLRKLCTDVLRLRRGDQRAALIRLEREKLALPQVEATASKDEEFWRMARDPRRRELLAAVLGDQGTETVKSETAAGQSDGRGTEVVKSRASEQAPRENGSREPDAGSSQKPQGESGKRRPRGRRIPRRNRLTKAKTG